MAQWFNPPNGAKQFQLTDRGYAVNSPPTYLDLFRNATLLNNENDYIPLLISELTTNFELTGQYNQSQHKRDFLPHAAQQPTLQIKGQTPNQYEAGRLAEFVRYSQLSAIGIHETNTSFSTTDPMFPVMTLFLQQPKIGPGNRNQKGGYRPAKIEGWVQAMPRGGRKFEFAPEWEMVFLVGAWHQPGGVLQDSDIKKGDDPILNKVTWEQIFPDLVPVQLGPPAGSNPAIQQQVGPPTPAPLPPASVNPGVPPTQGHPLTGDPLAPPGFR